MESSDQIHRPLLFECLIYLFVHFFLAFIISYCTMGLLPQSTAYVLVRTCAFIRRLYDSSLLDRTTGGGASS